MSRVFGYLLELAVAAGDSVHAGSAARTYEIGIVGAMPCPHPSSVPDTTAETVTSIWQDLYVLETRRETSRYFISPTFTPVSQLRSLRHHAELQMRYMLELLLRVIESACAVDREVRLLYGVDDETNSLIENEFGPDVCSIQTWIEAGTTRSGNYGDCAFPIYNSS